jgi:hypothetical protein
MTDSPSLRRHQPTPAIPGRAQRTRPLVAKPASSRELDTAAMIRSPPELIVLHQPQQKNAPSPERSYERGRRSRCRKRRLQKHACMAAPFACSPSAHPVLAGRRRFRANAALDRTVSSRPDSGVRGRRRGRHRVTASTHAQPPSWRSTPDSDFRFASPTARSRRAGAAAPSAMKQSRQILLWRVRSCPEGAATVVSIVGVERAGGLCIVVLC